MASSTTVVDMRTHFHVAADDSFADTFRSILQQTPATIPITIAHHTTPINLPPAPAQQPKQLTQQHSDSTRASHDYHNYLTKLRQLWTDCLDLTISYSDLAYDIPIPVTDPGIPNLLKSLYNAFTLAAWRTAHKSFLALQPTSGIVLPGQMTLVLAPPGHGKSTLLKALAGRLHDSSMLKGKVLYNGMTQQQAKQQHGLYVNKLTAYVDQGDIHQALLTVRETLQFALDNSVSDPALLEDEQFTRLHATKVDLMLDLLGLREAEHTILGNAVLRGVSGGQRRRVSIGEMMITNARALFLDEITTGLDSATSFDILTALRSWTRVMNGSTMIALLQPTPECFELFDNIVLLRQGAVIYHGPTSQVRAYLQSIGVPVPDDMDLADFLVDFLTDPAAIYQRTLSRAGHEAQWVAVAGIVDAELVVENDAADVAEAELGTVLPLLSSAQRQSTSTTEREGGEDSQKGSYTARKIFDKCSSSPSQTRRTAINLRHTAEITANAMPTAPLTTVSLVAAFHASAQHHINTASQHYHTCTTPRHTTISHLSPYTRAQFGQPYGRSFLDLLAANLSRSAKIMRRNTGFWLPRILQAVFLGCILGGLFYQLPDGAVQARVGLCLFAALILGFTNAADIPFAGEGKGVVYKQQDAGLYSAASYVWSVIVVLVPLSVIESAVLSALIYFLSGFTYEASNFLFFVLVMWLTNLSLSCVFRSITYVTRSDDVANMLSAPIIAVMFLLAGYVVRENSIPRWTIWLFWLSPFSWTLRSLAINEFDAARYAAPFAVVGSEYENYRTGEVYLRLSGIDPTWAYKWAGIGYLIGFFALMMAISTLLLAKVRYPLTTGTKRFLDEEAGADREDEAKLGTTPQQLYASTSTTSTSFTTIHSAATALPFQPVDLAWRDIHYSVMVDRTDGGKGKVARKLLDGISGYAKAGQLTALMGSSGAGKTTLMDVIAGRKTAGTIEGEILVNGHPKVTATFNRMCGYVEQTDTHWATQTVREALMFSAVLRLPATVTAAQRSAFVDEVLDILELTPIADRIIGDSELPGLSPGQLKRVTIGVELVANPPVLFLDEPTSGLDSRQARTVMRVVKRVSQTGRAVLCTIHQPSADLFSMFDRLLLLRSGGQEVYFGEIGVDGAQLVDYFHNAPTTSGQPLPRKPKSTNPASWMLDVIGAGVGVAGDERSATDYAAVYAASRLRESNEAELAIVASPKPGVDAVSFDHVYASSYATQFYSVTARTFQFYWRNPFFVWARQFLMVFLGCLLGFLYLQSGVGIYQDAISRMSAIYIGIGFAGGVMMASNIPMIFRIRPVFYREQSSYMYTPYAYALSLLAVEIFYTAFSALFFLIFFYPMAGFIGSGTLFFRYLLAQYLAQLIWLSVGQLNASWLPNILVANIVSALMGTFALLFSSVFITAGQMPSGWKWLYWMNWMPKALKIITTDQFSCANDSANCQPYPPTVLPSGEIGYNLTPETYIHTYLDSDYSYWHWVGWLLLTLLVLRILTTVAIGKVNYMKR